MAFSAPDEAPVASLGRDLVLYGASTVVLQGATVVLTPYLTRRLGPTSYGVYELLQVGVGLLSVVCVLGVDVAVLKRFFDEPDGAHQRRLITSGLAVVAACSVVGATVVLVARGPITSWLLGAGAPRSPVVAAALALPLLVVMAYVRQALRIAHRPRAYLTTSAVAAVAQIAAIVVLVERDRSVSAVFVGLSVGAVAAIASCIWIARSLLSTSVSSVTARGLIRFGLPLVLTGVSGWSVMFVDRILLTRFVSLADLGFYGLANKVALVLNLVIYSFGAAWPPYILGLAARDVASSRHVRARMLNAFVFAVAIVGVPVAALAPEVVRIVAGRPYAPAAGLIPVLVLAFLLYSTLSVTQIAMLVTEQTGSLAKSSVLAAVVNIAGCFALCPTFGVAGAAWATVAGFGIQAIAYYRSAQQLDPVDFRLRDTVALFVALVPALALGAWTPDVAVALVAKPLVLAITGIAVWRFDLAHLSELRRLRNGVVSPAPSR